MLHLSAVGADLRCVGGGADQDRAHAGAMAHRVDVAAAEVHAALDAGSHEPCQTPAQPECCRAMTSCAVTFGFAGTELADAAPRAPLAVVPSGTRLPASVLRAPDPPPPKA